MDLSDILAREPSAITHGHTNDTGPRQAHGYPTRQAHFSYGVPPNPPSLIPDGRQTANHGNMADSTVTHNRLSPRGIAKTVNFQLLLLNGHHRARLPLRVHIQPWDTTESIITTVKNFYGLYEGEGVSFEDSDNITLIAQYENLTHNTTIYVRITAEPPELLDTHARRPTVTGSPQKPRLDEPFQMLPPQPYSRPHSRATKKRSISPPSGRGRRSVSARAQNKPKIKAGGWHENEDMDGAANGMSDSDAGSVSVSSSRRAKSDQLASAEISLDNIVEGGRRKRAKFESSELPLFAPPQQPMTASMSSLSPQRRLNTASTHSPVTYTNQYNFTYHNSLPSPQSFTNGDYIGMKNNGVGVDHSNSHGHRLRGRASSMHVPSRLSGGSIAGVLPTPDPTIGSVISDEDVALQLMRLGDASNLSLGRTSTSTMDDALSGKAEAASSDEESDEESMNEEEDIPLPVAVQSRSKLSHTSGPSRKRQKLNEGAGRSFDSTDTSGEEYEDHHDGSFKGESDGLAPDALMHNMERSKVKTKSIKSAAGGITGKIHSSARPPVLNKSKSKSSSSGKIPPSPYSAPPAIRKASSASTATGLAGADEDDLSSQPRCQRCRKSKKGCDRQRPCQRCKDAGIGIEGCVSEDEGNGRKGRYGRHMGVTVKKDANEVVASVEQSYALVGNDYHDGMSGEAGKKRKR